MGIEDLEVGFVGEELDVADLLGGGGGGADGEGGCDGMGSNFEAGGVVGVEEDESVGGDNVE